MKRCLWAGLTAAVMSGAYFPAHALDDMLLAAQIDTLKQMTALGRRCSDRLDIDGKAAATGGVCGEYAEKFHVLWQSRNGLDGQINDLVAPYRNGGKACDGRCADVLVQIDQLKTTVIYYLDYIDFLKDM